MQEQDALARLRQELERRLGQRAVVVRRNPRRVPLVQKARGELDAAAGLPGEKHRRAEIRDPLQALLQFRDQCAPAYARERKVRP